MSNVSYFLDLEFWNTLAGDRKPWPKCPESLSNVIES